MSYKTIVKVAATEEPLSVDQARNQLRLDVGFDEDKISDLLTQARVYTENYCNRFFTEQTVLIVYDYAEYGSSFCLPYPDLKSVNSVKSYDKSGNETEVSGFTFNADLQKLYLPAAVTGEVVVEVVTGAPVEFEGAKIAMLMVLTDLYENRTESVLGASVAKNPALISQLYPYRINIGV